MQNVNGILKYFRSRIWDVRLEDRSKGMAFLFKQLRIVLIVSRNFIGNKLQVQSAGLTFYTMLSVVPLVALVFAIAKGFGIQNNLEEQLRGSLTGHEEVADQVMTFANRMLENTQSGLLAVVGVAILLWTVMSLLSNIETAFNDIWQVPQGRSWVRKFTEYFSIMLIAPVLISVSGSMQVLLTSGFENLAGVVELLNLIGPVVFFFIKMVPYFLIWMVFTFVYIVMPNTKVNFSSALIAGVIAWTSFILVQWVYINFQVGVSRYNAIYGSFAALPLFMVWANMSWLITLIGAEVAYANQNVTQIENEIDGNKLSMAQIHVLAMIICKQVSSNFQVGEKPLSAKTLSATLKIPFGVTNRVLELLVDSEVLTEVQTPGNEPNTFLPVRSFENMTIGDLMVALDSNQHTKIRSLSSAELSQYMSIYNQMREALKADVSNLKIRELPDLSLTKS
jgi:membrane protein